MKVPSMQKGPRLMHFQVQRDSALDNLHPNSHQSSCLHLPLERAQMTKSAELAKAASSSKGSEHSSVINSCNGSDESQNLLNSDASNFVPDEQSPAVGHNSGLGIGQHRNQSSSSVGVVATRKAYTKYSDEALLESSSLCSLGASNNRNVCCRKHDDIDDSVQNDEEPEDVMKEKPARTGVKRSRNAQVHNLCERKRRDKINKRMRILKELIPNCNKTDKASMLDDAIEYLKTLKLQLQIMTMGDGFCMPFMMLPNAAHCVLNAPHLQQLVGVEMGLRSGTTFPCNLPQFPITPFPAITDNRVHMFRFMPISHAPFIPMAENPSQLTTLLASLSNNSDLNGQTEHATKQPLNQVFPHH